MRCLGENDRRAGRSLISNFNQRYREAAFGRSLCLTRGLFDERIRLTRRVGCLVGWLAGAGGIEPCNNPLPQKDFSIPARPFHCIYVSKAKALVPTTAAELA